LDSVQGAAKEFMELKSATKTKQYELTYLVPGSMTDSELTKVQEEIQGLVAKHKGKIISEDAWGKKSLAYAIGQNGKDQQAAHYMHLVLEFDTIHTQAFEKDVYLVDEVIRHLLVEAAAIEQTTEEQTAEE
jgi:ribosomal protein S6